MVCEWERIFQCHFSLKLVEMNRLRVGRFLFEMVVWVNCFVLLQCIFLVKMAGAGMFMDVVVEFVVVRLWMWCKQVILSFSGMVVWGI